MRRLAALAFLCLTAVPAKSDALDDTLGPFCAQSAIAQPACKCAGDVMRRSVPPAEMDVILRFARNALSAEEIAKLPDAGNALREKFINAWRQAQTECGVKQ